MDARHTKDDRALEAGFPTASEEKTLLSEETSREPQPPRLVVIEKMPSPRHLLVTLALCFLFTFGLAHALNPKTWHRGPCHEKSAESQQQDGVEGSRFTNMLDAVSPDSLHDLLHRYLPERYQHGVYSSDQSALEAVHRDDAPLATSLAQLAKRQDTNSTSAPTTPPTSTGSDTTSSPSQTETSSTESTSSSAPPTSTSVSSTPSSSSTSQSSSSSSSSSRPSSITSTSAPTTSSPTRTSTPRSSKPTTSTYTSTLPDGAATTVVETSYVGVDDPNQATSTRPSGSLQTNAAVARNRGHLLEAAVGVLVGGALLV